MRMEGTRYSVFENVSHIDIPVLRSGDLTNELTVKCSTRQGMGFYLFIFMFIMA